MPKTMNEIKNFESLDLSPFEIRGAKVGINNATTTGPVLVSGTYDPYTNALSGDASFSSDSSIIGNISFFSPFASFDTSSMRVGDFIKTDSCSFIVQSILSGDSVEIASNSGLEGMVDFTTALIQREYLVEPDTGNNTFNGTATFSSGSVTVYGSGTSWLTELGSRDFIKKNDYQKYYQIDQVISNTELKLVENFAGTSGTGGFTAKRRKIGRMTIRYTRNDFSYDKESSKWEPNSITDTDVTTSEEFKPLADGIELQFTPSLNETDPDLMDSNTVLGKTFARSTQRETFQFSLPEVPNPEDTLEVYINGSLKDRFPEGNQNYVVSYHQDPVYLPPPPPDERRVANLMFLAPIMDQTLNPIDTATGTVIFVDSQGNSITGIMPESEKIYVDGTAQTIYEDYIFDFNSGTMNVTEKQKSEHVVDYIAVLKEDLLDFGFKVTLNSQRQKITFPGQPDDDVQIAVGSGKLKPADKDKPAPGEEYLVEYFVESTSVGNEIVQGISTGDTSFFAQKYPIKRDSIILVKNGIVLQEGSDFRVGYQTGRIVMFQTLSSSDSIALSYTPLAKNLNGISYSNKKDYCTVYNSRVTVLNPDNFELGLTNKSIRAENIEIKRVYNDTLNVDYDLTGVEGSGSTVRLQKNATNLSIGMATTQIITVTYKFEKEGTEYAPIIVNGYTIPTGYTSFYVEGQDVSSDFSVGSVVRLTPSDRVVNYYYEIVDVTFDGFDTIIDMGGSVTEDILNPTVSVLDNTVNYNAVPATASYVMSGSNQLLFPGTNIQNLFRPNAILRINDNLYQISGSSFNTETLETLVDLGSDTRADATDSTSLSTITYSDSPIYAEGDTVITTALGIVDDPPQPAFLLSTIGGTTLGMAADASNLIVDTDSSRLSFDYVNYPLISDISGGISSFIASAVVVPYALDWSSNAIVHFENAFISSDSSSLVSVNPVLRLDGSDSSAYVIEDGAIVLNDGLVAGQRYEFDYQGREFLGDSTVTFSARYFTSLPAGSEIVASFEYDNLDQFYIQVMSQRDFLDGVIIPTKKEQSKQLSGAGQGGEVTGDEDQGNAEGGLVDDYYRERDLLAECHVYDSIFDFFNDRLSAFSDEMFSATGLRMFNNDGTLSETDQSMGTLSLNRMYPSQDYTNFSPFPECTPLTGRVQGPGQALFITGLKDVISDGQTIWSLQLAPGDCIRPADTTTEYSIQTVVSDSSLVLDTTFAGSTSWGGVKFTASSGYPLFDDDGNVRAKIRGSSSGDFGLSDGDIFDATLFGTYSGGVRDETHVSVTFEESDNFLIALLNPLSGYDANKAASIINAGIDGMTAYAENIFDPNTTYGIKNVIVLRTDGTFNKMILGDGSAVTKLGFVPGDESFGNLDRTDSSAEIILTYAEKQVLYNEIPKLNSLIAAGTTNKLNRVLPVNMALVDDIVGLITDESSFLPGIIDRLDREITATGLIIEETTFPSYLETSEAHDRAIEFLGDSTDALSYAYSFLNGWGGYGDATKWVLDLEDISINIRGKTSVGIGVDSTVGDATIINGETSFILQASPGYDRRILDATVNSTYYRPLITYIDNSLPVDGSWTGWDLSVDGSYSANNQITFHFNDQTSVFVVSLDSTFTYDYLIDRTSINIVDASDVTSTFRYEDYVTIGAVKTAIDALPGLNVTGSSVFDGSNSESFKIAGGAISPDATIFPALRASMVDYQTISDMVLVDRTDFVNDRSSFITLRTVYLLGTREGQIKQNVQDEEILRSGDCEVGDLYLWADNRFNRRNGCEARLFQQRKLIESNQETLKINQRLIS